jgi:glycosyltransferase involved in cell wall biosynthesis
MARVSVAVPVFNGGALLEESLACIAGQTMSDFEVILSDNGSTDATPEICARFAAQDSRFRHLRREVTIGPMENFMFARDQAQAPYFLWRAYDDLSAPNYLQVLADLLDRCEESVLAVGDIRREGSPGTRERDFPYRPDDAGPRLTRLWAQMFRSSSSWYYGMWRREACIMVTEQIRILHPDVWATDHLTLFALALRDGIRGSHHTLFSQRIIHSARATVPWERLTAAQMRDQNARFHAACLTLLAQSDLGMLEKATVRLWLPFFVRKRCHAWRRIAKAKLVRG